MLRSEEAKKDKLCQELNMLVQQSAHAQLERLEQLTHRMESLNNGFTQSGDRPANHASSRAEPSGQNEDVDASTGNQFYASIF